MTLLLADKLLIHDTLDTEWLKTVVDIIRMSLIIVFATIRWLRIIVIENEIITEYT